MSTRARACPTLAACTDRFSTELISTFPRPGPECGKYIDHSRRAENGQSLSRALCSSSLDGSPLPPPPPLPTPCRLVQSTAAATRCSTRVHPARHGCDYTYTLSSPEGTHILADGGFSRPLSSNNTNSSRLKIYTGLTPETSKSRQATTERKEADNSLGCSSCQA